jgi:trehalose-6-phosphatase
MSLRLLSTDFDGTLVAHDTDPVFDPECLRLIQELQNNGAVWAINTGRSVQLLESGLLDFAFPAIGTSASRAITRSSLPQHHRCWRRCSSSLADKRERG